MKACRRVDEVTAIVYRLSKRVKLDIEGATVAAQDKNHGVVVFGRDKKAVRHGFLSRATRPQTRVALVSFFPP